VKLISIFRYKPIQFAAILLVSLTDDFALSTGTGNSYPLLTRLTPEVQHWEVQH
jgi:hypothetical protein